VTAGTNITYKILFNDAVAMTGGQPIDGQLAVDQITHQVRQEGVQRIAVITDEPEKYGRSPGFASGTTLHHRKELDQVQREMRDITGVTVLIYDQTCATEKRRRRKRGTFPDPAKRYFINDRVCEGCGDCGVQSNCVSIQPLETDFGRKRKIDQSSCNKDYSCVDGFCPSFVTVLGGKPARAKAGSIGDLSPPIINLPAPTFSTLPETGSLNLLVTGVGGTGIVTIGALLGMAAHIDDLGVSVVDQLGFAQKGGAVLTHLRLAKSQDQINAARINAGMADVLLACDMLVAGADNALAALDPARTCAVVNTEQNFTGDFTRNTDLAFPAVTLLDRIKMRTSEEGRATFNFSELARKLMGDSIGANLMMVGYAWQLGLIPISETAIFQAIELNGIATDWNKDAFNWGRCFAADTSLIDKHLHLQNMVQPLQFKPTSTSEWVEKYRAELILYQDEKYAEKYRVLMTSVIDADNKLTHSKTDFSLAVAKAAYKLMAYKDEYEVARLFTTDEFKQKLQSQFEGNYKLELNLAPPIISPTDKKTGNPAKMTFGPWMLSAFHLLAKFKFLRGTPLDIFGYLPERKMERELIIDYMETVDRLLADINTDNYELAVEIAGQPMAIRGYGHVKTNNALVVKEKTSELLEQWHASQVLNVA
jgi:indolepyruvate ferredoxin oxidoreductase